MQITRKSPLSGIVHTREINVTQDQLLRWEAGALIQDVMPDISSEDREFIISGITIEEWDTYIPEEEDTDDN